MKKQFLLVGAMVSMMATVQAQDLSQAEVPAAILSEFNAKYANAKDVEWEKENDLYNVEFELSGDKDHDVWYDATGKVVKEKVEISKDDLPQAVKDRINSDFKDFKADDVKKITENGKVTYKMELDKLLGEEWDVVIDSEGKVVSKILD